MAHPDSSDFMVKRPLVALTAQFLFVLKKTYDFPIGLLDNYIDEFMFDVQRPNLTSAVIYYLLSIIDRDKCVQLVPYPPKSTMSTAHFNQGVHKFLSRTFVEIPYFKIKGFTKSSLADPCGENCIVFIAQLTLNTVKLVYSKRGVLDIPDFSSLNVDDRLRAALIEEERAMYSLFQNISATTLDRSADISRYSTAVGKLKPTEERLKLRLEELLSLCPSHKVPCFDANNTKGCLAAVENWTAELKASSDKVDENLEFVKLWNYAISSTVQLMSSRKPLMLHKSQLLNSRNEIVLKKIADDEKITLVEGNSLVLPGFLDCSFVVAEKFSSILLNSPLYEQVMHSQTINKNLSDKSNIVLKVKNDCSTLEKEIALIKNNCRTLQHEYDELLRTGQIAHKYSFSISKLSPEVKLLNPVTAELNLSPGDSWKRELSAAKQRIKENDLHDNHNTPKSRMVTTRKGIGNSSMNNLTKTVLQKQAWASGSRGGDSTVEDMIPLSASSPVNSPPTDPYPHHSISDIIENISLLDSEIEFLPDVSDFRDTNVDTPGSHATFDESHTSHPTLEGTSDFAQPPVVNVPDKAVQSSIPVRRHPRPSIDMIIQRYTKLKQGMNTHLK